MGIMTFTIPGQLPGMNEIIKAAKSHFGSYSKLKKEYSESIINCILAGAMKTNRCIFSCQVDVNITWHCANKRRDPDNIMAGTKFILDALQVSGVIKNDNWNGIRRIAHEITLDRKNPRIEVELTEVKHELPKK
jgi:Holliday junction resolvase RusA-like endonuclease